jgi:hypothetical protein
MKKIKSNKMLKAILMTCFSMILVFGIFSCEIDKSINNSPNAITDEQVKSVEGINGLLIALQVASGDFYSGDRSRIASMWTRQMCAPKGLGRAQPVSWNTYQFQTDGFVDDMWKIGYRGVRIANDILNYIPIVTFADTDSIKIKNTYLGIAKAYKALLLGELAAFYGSIPISIKGLEAAQFATQTEAYTEVQKLLDEALIYFANSTTLDRDLNYNGDGAKWTKSVHSLKARYYLHTMDYTKAASEAALGMSDSGAELFGIYNDAAGEYSPWGHWTLTETGEPIRVEKTFMDLLKAEAGDIRISEYFDPNEEGNYVGFAYFNKTDADSTELNPSYTAHLKKYGAYADDFPLMTYNETILILAEAAARTDQNTTATTNLNIIRNAVGLTNYSGTDLIGEILKQKFLTLFLEGQSYTDMRRTKTMPNPNMPLRFIYPLSEYNANPNVPGNSDNLVIWTK